MVYLFLALGVLVFVICFRLLDVVPRVRAVAAASREALGIIRSDRLADEAKEVAIREAALLMARSTALILGRLALCVLMPIAAVWLGAQSGAYTTTDALAAASSWAFIIPSTVVTPFALMAGR